MGEFARSGLAGFLEVVLEPVECPDLGVLVLPVLHPAYQHSWLPPALDAAGEPFQAAGRGLGERRGVRGHRYVACG